MSETVELLRNYNIIRERLMFPPNAVIDRGIDLRRSRIPPEVPIPPVIEYLPSYPQAIVTVREIAPKRPIPTISTVERVVCAYFLLRVDELHNGQRGQRLTYPRHIFWYLCRRHTNLSFPRIAMRCDPYLRKTQTAQRDHTSIIHAERRIAKLIAEHEPTAEIVRALESMIRGGPNETNNKPNATVATVTQLHLAEKQDLGVPKPEVHKLD